MDVPGASIASRSNDNAPLRVFISYAHDDGELKRVFDKSLKVLQRQGLIAAWSDAELLGGEAYEHAIAEQMKQSQVLIFMVSNSLLASDFIQNKEVPLAMHLKSEGRSIIVPVVLRDTPGWESEKWALGIHALPSKVKPVDEWETPERAFADVERELRKMLPGIPRLLADVRRQAQRAQEQVWEAASPEQTAQESTEAPDTGPAAPRPRQEPPTPVPPQVPPLAARILGVVAIIGMTAWAFWPKPPVVKDPVVPAPSPVVSSTSLTPPAPAIVPMPSIKPEGMDWAEYFAMESFKKRHGFKGTGTDTNTLSPELSKEVTRSLLAKAGGVVPDAITKATPYILPDLGMKFVPVAITGEKSPRTVYFSIWETRVRDYQIFVREGSAYLNAAPPSADGLTVESAPSDQYGWRDAGGYWGDARFPPSVGYALPENQHPVVCVSFHDASAFCEWLTARERTSGRLPAGWSYRLPTDHEWSCAVGLAEDAAQPLSTKQTPPGITAIFPWSNGKPVGFFAHSIQGNYAGEESRVLPTQSTQWPINDGYKDPYPRTAPVGSFPPNFLGIYDLGGNAGEWCSTLASDGRARITRGGSWASSGPVSLAANGRSSTEPTRRIDYDGFRVVLSPK